VSQSWVGRTIGNRYRLETLLGAGGMSAVYRAYDPNLRRVVAVKLIHPHLSDNPHFVERFKEEAAAVASLRHPNIVQVHDFSSEGETYYMVMEYLAGETLQARLRRVHAAGRQMPLGECLRICLQICDAADYAHRHDLVHRDIKPANIMLDVHGQAILMDFGIVKIVGGQYHTGTGATIGTAIYMSPEQIRGERVDGRSDIYSMGVMLFEMLSGRPPYEADSALTLMMMHLNDPIPDPCELRHDLPPLLAGVALKALAKDRDERYPSAVEMSRDLQAVRAGLAAAPAVHKVAAAAAPEPTLEEPSLDEAGLGPAEGEEPVAAADDRAASGQPVTPAPTRFESEPAAEALPGALREAPAGLEQAAAAPPSDAGDSEQAKATAAPAAVGPAATLPETPSAADEAAVLPAGRGTAPEAAAPLSALEEPAARRRYRWLLPLVGLGVLAALAVVIAWFAAQRRPPDLQLMPIGRPAIPINLETQSRLVSLGQWQVDAVCTSLAFSPDAEVLAAACNREKSRSSQYRYYASLYAAAPGVLQAHLLDHSAWMNSVDFSPDGSRLATAAEEARIDVWETRDGALLRTIESGEGPIASVDFAPGGEMLAGATWHGAGIWQVSNGVLLRMYLSDDDALGAVAFSADGQYLAGGSVSGMVYLWRVSDGTRLLALPGQTAVVNQLAFSPDGSRLASASADKSINLWSIPDGELVYKLTDHGDGVTGVAFSPDGSLLASSSWDGTLRLWQASDGGALQEIQGEDSLMDVTFSPDGAWMVSASGAGQVDFWGVSEIFSRTPAP
jgi:sugar lactone lactonase YvrE